MSGTVDWTAIGSLATAAAVVVAAVAIFITWLLADKAASEERAAALRSDIQYVAVLVQQVVPLMLDGIPIILACDHTMDALRSDLPPDYRIEDLQSLLCRPSGPWAAATRGWHTVEPATELSRTIDSLWTTCERLSSSFALLSAAGRLIRQTRIDGYSPNVLAIILSPPQIFAFLNGRPAATGESILLDLRDHLQAHCLYFFRGRYGDALLKLQRVIHIVATQLGELTSKELLGAAAHTSSVVTGDIDVMRAELPRLARVFTGDITVELVELVDAIGVMMSKEHFQAEIEALPPIPSPTGQIDNATMPPTSGSGTG